MITLKKVNKELAKKFDNKLELRKGKDYFYFSGELADKMYRTGIYTNRLNALTIEEIIEDAEYRLK